MTALHTLSIDGPLPAATATDLVLLRERLAFMGVAATSDASPAATLDALERLGIGAVNVARLRGSEDPAVWEEGVARLLELVEQSPAPAAEWETLAPALGDELLGELVAVSRASLVRYRGGQRVTPDDVAARLHHIAMITADLAGSYNEIGIRRWFDRPRSALDGRSPREVLSGTWDPDDDGPATVRDLARSLVTL